MSRPTATEDQRPLPDIDPRIRARRIAVARREGRRRLHLLVGFAVAAAVVGGVVGLAVSPALNVDHVTVAGTRRLDPAAVEAASGVDRGEALVLVDEGAAATALRALPWVADATVRRSWPGTVRISVVEREPVAAVVHADGVASLVDRTGRVLEEVPGDAAGVPLVVGLEAPGPPGSTLPAAGGGAVEVAAGLPADLAPRVGRVLVDAEQELALELAVEGGDPVLVRLGDDGDVAAKLSALVTVVASVDVAGYAVIDVAVPTAPALTPR